MYRTAGADPFLYENLLVTVDDLVAKIGKQGGGWYNFATESCQTKSGWKAIPWFWVSFPGTYNQAHFKKAGFEQPPKTGDELLKMGKVLKKQGNPIGIPITTARTRTSTYWSSRRSRAPRAAAPQVGEDRCPLEVRSGWSRAAWRRDQGLCSHAIRSARK